MSENEKSDSIELVEDESFKKITEQSKDRIKAAQEAKIPREKKRSRGRPPKIQPEVKTEAKEPAVDASPVPAPSIAPFIKQPLIFLSKIPAHKHKIPELALSNDEADMCAQSLDLILQAFVPDIGKMDPKTAAIVSGLSVFGSIGFQKYMIFRSKRQIVQENLKPVQPADAQAQAKKSQDDSGVSSSSYFDSVSL